MGGGNRSHARLSSETRQDPALFLWGALELLRAIEGVLILHPSAFGRGTQGGLRKCAEGLWVVEKVALGGKEGSLECSLLIALRVPCEVFVKD